jgi:hypothetical protein
MSNPVSSYMAGHNYDRYRRLAVPTGFSARFPADWTQAVPFFEGVGEAFEAAMPDVSEYMHDWCRTHGIAPHFTIGRTCLSSVAINVNYESCYHFDQGDLPSGYSTLTAMAVGGAYRGGCYRASQLRFSELFSYRLVEGDGAGGPMMALCRLFASLAPDAMESPGRR